MEAIASTRTSGDIRGKETKMLTTEIRAQIEQMIARMDAAIAAGKTLDSRTLPMYQGAKAALACTDAKWLARAAKEDARTVVVMAAQGDISGAYKLI